MLRIGKYEIVVDVDEPFIALPVIEKKPLDTTIVWLWFTLYISDVVSPRQTNFLNGVSYGCERTFDS